MLVLLSSTSLSAFAMNASAPMGKCSMHEMHESCKPVIDKMKSNHEKIEAAIKANNSTAVGKLVIEEHNFMVNFEKTHPECKMFHNHHGGMMDMDASASSLKK